MRRWLILTLAISLLGATCGAPSNKSDIVDKFPKGPITLEVWRPFDEAEAYLAAAESYRNLHPNVTIKYRFIEPSVYETELINALANGTGPDIISLDHDRLPAFADKLVEMPAEFFKGSDPLSVITARYSPAVAQDVIFEGKAYGIPMFTDSLALYWNRGLSQDLFKEFNRAGLGGNKDLLLRAPVDWDEVVEVVKLLTKRNGNTIERSGIALGLSSNVPHTADIIAALMLQRGVSMVAPDHKSATYHVASVNDPNFYPGAAVLDYLKGFVDPNSSYYTWNAEMPNAVDAFIEGKVVMMINNREIKKYIEQRNPNLDFRITPLPQLPNARTIVDYADYSFEAVTKNADLPQVAWDFLSHISKFGLGVFASRADRTNPLRRQTAFSTVSQRMNIINRTFEQQVPTAQSWFKGVDADAADAILAAALDRVSRNGQPARDSLNQAASAFNALLSSP